MRTLGHGGPPNAEAALLALLADPKAVVTRLDELNKATAAYQAASVEVSAKRAALAAELSKVQQLHDEAVVLKKTAEVLQAKVDEEAAELKARQALFREASDDLATRTVLKAAEHMARDSMLEAATKANLAAAQNLQSREASLATREKAVAAREEKIRKAMA